MSFQSLFHRPIALAMVLAFILTTASVAETDTGKLYPSKDGVFSVLLSPQFFKRLSDGGQSVFNAVSTDGVLVLVFIKTAEQKIPLANIKRDFPKRAGPSWKILGSEDSTVGGKPAVFYRLSNLFPNPNGEWPQILKTKFGLPATSKYNTLMAIVPTSKGTYTFQVHHHQSLGDQGWQAAAGLFRQLVVWP